MMRQGSMWRGRCRRSCLTIGAITLVVGLGICERAVGQCEPEQTAKLTADDGAEADYFGGSVSVSEDTVVIGASLDDDNGEDSGSAYVFERQVGVWTQTAKLTADDGEERDLFGHAVSVSGDTTMIGANKGAYNLEPGSVYVFERQSGIWTQAAQLTASDGYPRDYFGTRLAVSGDTAVMNGRESAYVFERMAGVWTQTAKLTGNDGTRFNGSVSVSGDTVIAAGGKSAYVFERQGGVWVHVTELVADDRAPGDGFGRSVSISGDTAVIGATYDDDNGEDSGSAYVFKRQGGVWTQTAKLTADDGAAFEFFGGSVCVSDDTALIGAHGDRDHGYYTGSAYAFERQGGVWTQTTKLTADDGASNDYFGGDVSVSGDIAVIGVSNDDDHGYSSGSAYVFQFGVADLDGSGSVDSGDIVAVLARWGDAGGPEDLDGSGVVDFGDVIVVLTAWGPCE